MADVLNDSSIANGAARGAVSPDEAAWPIFAALGDRTRMQLVRRIARGGAPSISTLTAGTGLTRQGVTKHLRVLSDAGVVREARTGRETRFTLARDALMRAQVFLSDIECEAASAPVPLLRERPPVPRAPRPRAEADLPPAGAHEIQNSPPKSPPKSPPGSLLEEIFRKRADMG